MSTPRPLRPALLRRRLIVLCLLIAAPTMALAEPWYAHYEKADEALAAGDWAVAVEQLQAALERRGDSGSRVRTYGMRVVDYFPYLKLGIAYHHLGRHQAALEAFATEERLGAVADSAEARQELDRFQALATAARDRLADAARDDTETRIAEALAEARGLAEDGRWDDAMAALGPALALAPDGTEANRLMNEYRAQSLAVEQHRQRQLEAARDLRRARALLADGDAEGAAALLRRQLDQTLPDDQRQEIAALLDQARSRIAAVAQEVHQGQRVAQAYNLAQRAWQDGDSDSALESLESVFAVQPDHREALALRRRIVASLDEAEREAQIARFLEEAQQEFDQGRWERSLAAANRVLALDAGRREALDAVRRAYDAISRHLVSQAGASGAPGENLPPAIRFADRRQRTDGEPVQRLSTPQVELTGVVIDRTPVELTLTMGDGAAQPLAASGLPVGDLFITEFRIDRGLAAGRTVFRLEATDPEGLSSSSEYVVLYRRPWFRAPWFWWALGLILLGLAVAWMEVLRRRRRARLQRRFNPYIAGGPVFDEKLFFGREALLRRVLATLHNNSLMLHGERRIGKTSLLHQIRQRLEASDDPEFTFLPVYIDLQGTPEDQFFALLADHIHEALPPDLRDPSRTPAQERSGSYDHHHLVRDLHGWIRALGAATDKQFKLVLLIDEVDELNDYDPRVNQKLRSLFMKRFATHLVAVVAGVRIRKEWDKEGSPWYNFFEEMAVGEIDPAAARRLVVDPIRGTFKVEAGVAEHIVEKSGGKPYLIQRHCLALVSHLHEQGRSTLTLADCAVLDGKPSSVAERS